MIYLKLISLFILFLLDIGAVLTIWLGNSMLNENAVSIHESISIACAGGVLFVGLSDLCIFIANA